MIEKYLDAFPYLQPYVCADSEKLFYIKKTGSAKKLCMANLSEGQTFADGIEICAEDFSKRNYSALQFDKKSNLLYLGSDNDNKENLNIYALDIANTGD